ncbi:helix-turn-helix domain-containing protein [Sporosarcina ureilytica]|uniref:HTH cro/C1-type domain-containing protein n=1 Tax=Sporosarcina ureilytica TaxID=298596 RepID=A0A1D8JHD1_9BACL|nr:XRE family transcriptional regulator [Sporosarcina ureilytica]AOV08127.1 hypothetical protein BI350_11645 [Sporosarcina ureilytica]
MEENLGILIKQIRKQKKMTLKSLSEQTELSISFLSQLERGKSSATLNSLKKISLALDVNPGYFFNDVTEEGEVTSSDALKTRQITSPQFSYKDLSGQLVNPAFAPMLITLKPGQNEGESFSHAGQEFLYVLKGELTLQIEDRTQTLQPHQSIMFDSNQVHYWYNYTNDEVQFLCISYDEK